jgi:hypothetical protein
MRIKLSELKKIIREEVSLLNEQLDVEYDDDDNEEGLDDETMTHQEAERKARSMKLPSKAIDFIVSEFIKHGDDSSYGQIGSDGKISYGQSWEDVFNDLADALGYDKDTYDENEEQLAHVEKIFNEFFEE